MFYVAKAKVRHLVHVLRQPRAYEEAADGLRQRREARVVEAVPRLRRERELGEGLQRRVRGSVLQAPRVGAQRQRGDALRQRPHRLHLQRQHFHHPVAAL